MNLISGMSNYLTEPPKRVRPFFRYVLLLFAVILLGAHVHWRLNLSPELRTGYRIDMGIVALLTNVLAFQFNWPIAARAVLRSLATILVLFYFCYAVYSWYALYL